MTIADNIDFLNEAKDFFEDVANDPKIKETVKTYFIIESLETAIEIMQKYQKIQEQVELSEKENHKIDVARMIQIREFIYGNDT